MQAAAAHMHELDHTLKAVCHKCHYVGLDAGQRSCPLCSFPLILEQAAGDTQAIEQIFDRTSVSIGAPPLPGVDGRPRKAQLLAEARKRRRTAQRQAQPHGVPALRRRPTTVREIVRKPRVRVSIAMVSALLAGFVAAMINAGV